MYAVLQHNAANETQAPSAFPVSAVMSNYCTTARQGAKNDRDYGARHPVLRDSIVLHHGCVLAYGQRAPRAPHRKCRRIGGRYFNREKSGDVAPAYPGSYRPRIRTGYVAFFSRNFSDRPPASDSRSAAEFECEESAYPNTPDPGRYCLASATSSTTILARSEYTCAHSCLRCNSLFAPAQSLAGSL